jgi:aquaporin NIP
MSWFPWRKALAEAVGTFALVFAGCGAVGVEATTGALGHVGVSAVFGLVVGVMIYATGHVSGAHFNPAVTLAFASLGEHPWRQVPAYIAAQVLAALAASGLLLVLLGGVPGVTSFDGSVGQALGIEAVLTFFLMFVITAVATDARAEGSLAGVAIGGTVALGALMGGPLTGASMNPARSLGPALVGGDLAGLWVYLLAPILGALAGAWVYRALKEPSTVRA